jgi:hypothetical protein
MRLVEELVGRDVDAHRGERLEVGRHGGVAEREQPVRLRLGAGDELVLGIGLLGLARQVELEVLAVVLDPAASFATAAGSATASFQPWTSALRKAFSLSRSLSMLSCSTQSVSEARGRPLSANGSVTG